MEVGSQARRRWALSAAALVGCLRGARRLHALSFFIATRSHACCRSAVRGVGARMSRTQFKASSFRDALGAVTMVGCAIGWLEGRPKLSTRMLQFGLVVRTSSGDGAPVRPTEIHAYSRAAWLWQA